MRQGAVPSLAHFGFTSIVNQFMSDFEDKCRDGIQMATEYDR